VAQVEWVEWEMVSVDAVAGLVREWDPVQDPDGGKRVDLVTQRS
jgi:hypothetical protein